MRLALTAFPLLLVVFSIFVDLMRPSPATSLCEHGFCLFDQIFEKIDAQGASVENVGLLVLEDPANPLVWCTWAELVALRGDTNKAGAAFDHALRLGPGMSPVWMRTANFDFTHGRLEHALHAFSQILIQTDAFNEVVFSYLTSARIPVPRLLGSAIPATPQASRAWLGWLGGHGSDTDLLATWSWMRQNRLSDQPAAVNLAWTLCNRQSYRAAQRLWMDWLGPQRGDPLRPQLLTNCRFQQVPTGSPFDWTITSAPNVTLARTNGLEVRFSGTENVAFSHVSQLTTARVGRYRFSAEIQTDEITTDQGPLFHVFDPADPRRLNVETPALQGTTPRSWISLDFNVAPGTEALQVRFERRPSECFDNRIAGTLHVYQVSLAPLSYSQK
jgi:hypothetical protein